MARLGSVLSVLVLLAGFGIGLSPGPLQAAEKKPANTAWMQAGKADTKAAFAKQAASAPKPAAWPTIVGEYLWGGRADDQYKPFFMFELRVRGATKTTEETRYRVVTLDPARKPQSSGPWVTLGKLQPGETRDLSYKMNCPIFSAFQVEIAWKDAGKEVQETYLAWDKVAMLPVALSEVANIPYVVNLNPDFEHDAAKKVAAVRYTVWNIGGQPAKDVVQTLHFKSEAGKTVHSHEIKPAKGETAREYPAGYIGEVKLNVPKVPPFAYISIATKMSDAAITVETSGFTGANDVEIAHVRADGTTLKAKVRNGYKTPVSGVVVTITLTDGNGKAVKTFSLPAGDLTPGQERELSTELGTTKTWSGYEVGWSSSESTTPK